jgi:hypothetical protein
VREGHEEVRHTEGSSHEDGGRDWRDAATSQGTPGATGNGRKQEAASQGLQPGPHMVLGFCLREELPFALSPHLWKLFSAPKRVFTAASDPGVEWVTGSSLVDPEPGGTGW